MTLSDDDVLDLVGEAAKANGGRIGDFQWQRHFARLVQQLTADAAFLQSSTTREQFDSNLNMLLADHKCDSWAPRCKHCDQQEQARKTLLVWFVSKTTALELANEHRGRLIALQRLLVAAGNRMRFEAACDCEKCVESKREWDALIAAIEQGKVGST